MCDKDVVPVSVCMGFLVEAVEYGKVFASAECTGLLNVSYIAL